MGFGRGSLSFKRLYVGGERIDQVAEAFIEKLTEHAMGRDVVQTADRSEAGWTTGEHILDTEFSWDKNVIADGLHFALRVDTNKTPPDIVRSYQYMNEKAMLEASGREFLSKAEKREAREQAKSRADKEADEGNHRRMKQFPVFWDVTHGCIYLGTASNGPLEKFMMLFRETFDLAVTPASSGEVAARYAARSGETRAFDDSEPAHFISPPDGAELGADSDRFMENAAKDFLGTEWLTWLWYVSHVESSEIVTSLGKTVTVLFDKGLQLDCAFKLSGSLSIRSDAPTRLPEALVALAGGKRPIRVGLQVATQGDLFSLNLRGDAMNFGSVQLPQVEEATSPRNVFEERIEKLRDLTRAIDDLYGLFLKKRLSSKWQQTLNMIRTWVVNADTSQPMLEAAS